MKRKELRLVVIRLCCLLWAATAAIALSQDETAHRPQKIKGGRGLIILANRSQAAGTVQPPEAALACVQALIDSSSISPEPVHVAVVLYGAGEVRVAAGRDGVPTTARGVLHARLMGEWLPTAGSSPLDEALQKVLNLVDHFERDSDITLLHLGADGPASGRLRPETFPEIQERIEKRRREILENSAGFEAVAAAKLARFEQELKDVTTREFRGIYAAQLPLEAERCRQHAESLKNAGVRVMTLNLTADVEVEELHKAAGGAEETCIAVSPDRLIDQMSSVASFALPGMIRLKELVSETDPQSIEASWPVAVDRVAESVGVFVRFDPPIAEFADHVTLSARADGSGFEFTEDSEPGDEAFLLNDAEGNVVGARLLLESAPSNGRIVFTWKAPGGTRTVPAIHTQACVKLKPGLIARFQPQLKNTNERPPHTVSPEADVTWQFSLEEEPDSEPYPVADVDVGLRERRGGDPVSLAFQPDPHSAFLFVTDALRLPTGVYDAEIAIRLESGLLIETVLRDAVTSRHTAEIVTFEIPQPRADQPDETSAARSHLDFGTLGDTVTERTLVLILRLKADVNYPIPVRLGFELADPNGIVPRQSWIRFSRERLTLVPGRAETIRVTVSIPDDVEEAIVDGAFEGRVLVLREDSGLPLPVERFEPLEGVPADAPVDRLTFTLQRPVPDLSLPYAWHDWVVEQKDGTLEGVINVSFHQPFRREVVLEVTNESETDRAITVIPAGAMFDRRGSRVPSIELTPLDDTTLEQPLGPGETGTWRFVFSIDPGCTAPEIIGSLDITGEGIRARHLPVVIRRRNPLLVNLTEQVLWGLVGLLATLALKHLVNRLRARRFSTGTERIVTDRKPLPGICTIEKERDSAVVRAEQDIDVTAPGVRSERRLRPGQSLRIELEQVSESTPVVIQPVDGQGLTVELVEWDDLDELGQEARAVVSDGTSHDEAISRAHTGLLWTVPATAGLVCLAMHIREPSVVRAAQWIHDLIFYI